MPNQEALIQARIAQNHLNEALKHFQAAFSLAPPAEAAFRNNMEKRIQALAPLKDRSPRLVVSLTPAVEK